jgi:hypothetical protein
MVLEEMMGNSQFRVQIDAGNTPEQDLVAVTGRMESPAMWSEAVCGTDSVGINQTSPVMHKSRAAITEEKRK